MEITESKGGKTMADQISGRCVSWELVNAEKDTVGLGYIASRRRDSNGGGPGNVVPGRDLIAGAKVPDHV